MDYQQQTVCQNLVYFVLSVAELSGLTVDVHAHRVSMSCELSLNYNATPEPIK